MEPIGTFYAGILDFGEAAPDYEGIAEAVNFLRERQAIHGLDHIDLPDDIFYLICLQLSN